MNDNSVYEVLYTDGTTDQVTDNIISGHMLSKVDSEGHHYQVLTEVTNHNRYYSIITKVDGLVKSGNGNIHRKRKTCGWKILLEWNFIGFH